MNDFFPEIKKNFGFGCMRLPLLEDKVDLPRFTEMVDMFMARGFNYFDTARPYLGGQSETALRQCLTSRYPRESFVLTNKLSFTFFENEEDIRPLFASQLEACGVEYFDFYLMHAISGSRYGKYVDCRAFEIARELKAEGKIKHIGMSFHDTPEVLDRILTEQPCIEAVQIQFNYLDAYSPVVRGMACLEVCRKHNKPVIIMEPVKGGNLMNLPEEAKAVLDGLKGGSYASYAIRYAASQEGVMMVLSGMSSEEQMADNLGFMENFRPLEAKEYEAIAKVRGVFDRMDLIPCTACRYCCDGCPMGLDIPMLLASYNDAKFASAFTVSMRLDSMPKEKLPTACVGCGACAEICPQHIDVPGVMREFSEMMKTLPNWTQVCKEREAAAARQKQK